jgi:hypothetical protein
VHETHAQACFIVSSLLLLLRIHPKEWTKRIIFLLQRLFFQHGAAEAQKSKQWG